jgi:hypothetical protein
MTTKVNQPTDRANHGGTTYLGASSVERSDWAAIDKDRLVMLPKQSFTFTHLAPGRDYRGAASLFVGRLPCLLIRRVRGSLPPSGAGRATPRAAPSAQSRACHGLGTVALADGHSAVALRAFRIWFSVPPPVLGERGFQRSSGFARSGLLGGGLGGWRRLRCRRLEEAPTQRA